MKQLGLILANIALLLVCLAFFVGVAVGGVYLIGQWKGQETPQDQTPPAPCDSGPPLTSC